MSQCAADACTTSAKKRPLKRRRNTQGTIAGTSDTSTAQRTKLDIETEPRDLAREIKVLTFDDINPLFALPLVEAASTLGVCTTNLKKQCRRLVR